MSAFPGLADGFRICVYICLASLQAQAALGARPNFVLILADDLGIGDVGCFGNTSLRTPHIDSIARQGATLTHHVAAESLCTPSRAAFLTGRYALRSGMAAPPGVPRVITSLSALSGLPANETTIAELLQSQGYRTGFIGKWHLGLHSTNTWDFKHHPLNQGFNFYYGSPFTNIQDFGDDGEFLYLSTMPNADRNLVSVLLSTVVILLTMWRRKIRPFFMVPVFVVGVVGPLVVVAVCRKLPRLNSVLMRDHEVIEQPIRLEANLTQRLAREGIQFMERSHQEGAPFLLVMSWLQVHVALHTAAAFRGRSAHGRYGDNVEEMDWGVGEILGALDRLNLKDTTFVYFASDHGSNPREVTRKGEVVGGWNGKYRGLKSQSSLEGAVRVPSVVMFPALVAAGLEVDAVTSNMDVFATLADLAGVALPSDRIIDGRSMKPLLEGRTGQSAHDVLYHYCGEAIHAARYSPEGSKDIWKLYWGDVHSSTRTGNMYTSV